LGYKILALIIAVVLWMVTLNAEDPVITREFSNVTVTEVNADVITEAGKAYSFANGVNKVNVRISGRTSIVNNVTRDDIKATVDLSKLSDITGAVPVDVSCDRYPGVDVSTEGSSGILRIEIEDTMEKSLKVQVQTSGSAADGKYIGAGSATPNLITISGPKSVVGKVAGAVVRVAVNEGNSTDILTNSSVELVDSNGSEISNSSLKLSESDISVKIPIYNTKTVPVNLEITGSPPQGYSVISSDYEPKQVTIAGPDDALAKISSVVLKNYDISGSTGKVEKSLVVSDNLKGSLPDGVSIVDTTTAVALAVDIEKSGEETYSVPADQIKLTGSSSDLSYTVTGESTDTIPVIVNSTEKLLSQLTADNISGDIDVSGLKAGEYDLKVNVELAEGYTISGQPKAHVVIKAAGETE